MNRLVLVLLGAIGALGLVTLPASAQATRTWVSGVGDDANPCSRTAPCKTFAGAISKTATGGEINCLDPGGFGGLTIIKSISILCDHTEAGALVSGTNAFIVNLPATGEVYLRGIDFEGLGTGLNAIRMIGGGKLMVEKSIIRNFTQNGIDVAGASARVFINDVTIISNNNGVSITGASNTAFVQRSTIDINANAAVLVDGVGRTVVLSENVLAGSGLSDLRILNGATAISYGNNLIRNGDAPTQTVATK